MSNKREKSGRKDYGMCDGREVEKGCWGCCTTLPLFLPIYALNSMPEKVGKSGKEAVYYAFSAKYQLLHFLLIGFILLREEKYRRWCSYAEFL